MQKGLLQNGSGKITQPHVTGQYAELSLMHERQQEMTQDCLLGNEQWEKQKWHTEQNSPNNQIYFFSSPVQNEDRSDCARKLNNFLPKSKLSQLKCNSLSPPRVTH